MKTHRIYGIKNKKLFYRFPKGDNVMKHIKLTVYHKKKLVVYYGNNFKSMGIQTWGFHIGDVLCYITITKKNKFKVYDDNGDIFAFNQLAGVYYLQEQFLPDLTDEEVLRIKTDDERIRLGNLINPPFREMDSILVSLLSKTTYVSPTTKMSERDRCILSTLIDESFELKDYEVNARNEIIISNYNSWMNRFGKDIVMNSYVLSDQSFNMLFNAIDMYFFGNILKKIAVWRFSFEAITIKPDPKRSKLSIVGIKFNKDNIKGKNIKDIITVFQCDLIHVLAHLLGVHKKRRKIIDKILNRCFNMLYMKKSTMFQFKIKNILNATYQELYHKGQGVLMME